MTRNLEECETLKRTFRDTANRSHQNRIRFIVVVFDGHAGGGGADSARTSHRTPNDINLEVAERICSSLHRDSARAICDVSAWLSRETLTSSGIRRLVAGLGRRQCRCVGGAMARPRHE